MTSIFRIAEVGEYQWEKMRYNDRAKNRVYEISRGDGKMRPYTLLSTQSLKEPE
jgi:hypothetical protein